MYFVKNMYFVREELGLSMKAIMKEYTIEDCLIAEAWRRFVRTKKSPQSRNVTCSIRDKKRDLSRLSLSLSLSLSDRQEFLVNRGKNARVSQEIGIP